MNNTKKTFTSFTFLMLFIFFSFFVSSSVYSDDFNRVDNDNLNNNSVSNIYWYESSTNSDYVTIENDKLKIGGIDNFYGTITGYYNDTNIGYLTNVTISYISNLTTSVQVYPSTRFNDYVVIGYNLSQFYNDVTFSYQSSSYTKRYLFLYSVNFNNVGDYQLICGNSTTYNFAMNGYDINNNVSIFIDFLTKNISLSNDGVLILDNVLCPPLDDTIKKIDSISFDMSENSCSFCDNTIRYDDVIIDYNLNNECGNIPFDKCEITQSTTFDNGYYYLPSGIIINGENIIIDCNDSILDGINGTCPNVAFYNDVYNGNTIKNCNIKNYNNTLLTCSLLQNQGIVSFNPVTILNNNISNTPYCVEVWDYTQNVNLINNTFSCDVIYLLGSDSVYSGNTFNLLAFLIFGWNHTFSNNQFNNQLTFYSDFIGNNTGIKYNSNIFQSNIINYIDGIQNTEFNNNIFIDSFITQNNNGNNITWCKEPNTFTNTTYSGNDNIYCLSNKTIPRKTIKYEERFKQTNNTDNSSNYWNVWKGNSGNNAVYGMLYGFPFIFNEQEYNNMTNFRKVRLNNTWSGLTSVSSINQCGINLNYGFGMIVEPCGSTPQKTARYIFSNVLNNQSLNSFTPFEFTEDDVLSFTCKSNIGYIYYPNEYLMFGKSNVSSDSNNIIALTSRNNGGESISCNNILLSTFNELNSTNLNIKCCGLEILNKTGFDCSNKTKSNNFNLTYTDLVTGCGFSSDSLKNIERFDILSSSGALNGNMEFGDLIVFNNSNYMPDVNVSLLKNVYCLTNSEEKVNVNFSISSFDDEGDEILYSTSAYTTKNNTQLLSFTTQTCALGICSINKYYGDLFKLVAFENTCNVTIANPINNDYLFLFKGFDRYDNERYFLHLRDSCKGTDKSIYYPLNQQLNIFQIDTDIYTLSNNNSMNISLLDYNLNPVLIFGLEVNNTDVNLYNYNSTGKNLITTLSSQNLQKGYNIILKGLLNNQYGVALVDENVIYSSAYLDILSNNKVMYYRLSWSNESITDISLANVRFDFENVVFDWTNQVPNNKTFFKGVSDLVIYYTDSNHLGKGKYEFLKEEIKVINNPLCSESKVFEVTDDLFEYTNPKGYTGNELKINQFLWFIRFPYRFALYFNFADVMQLAVSIFFVIGLFALYIQTHQDKLGTGLSVNALIIIGFGMSVLLYICSLVNGFLVILFGLAASFIIYQSVINKNDEVTP